MNILLLSNYSPYTTAVLLKRGFEQAGHTVFAAAPEAVPEGWLRCDVDVDVNGLVNRFAAPIDFLIYVEAGASNAFFPRGLLDSAMPTVFWAIDNHVNYQWHRAIANVFDLTLLAQKDFLSKARREMHSKVEWLPLAADLEWHSAPADRRPTRFRDVVFVGNVRGERKAFFHALRERIPTFEIKTGVFGSALGQLYAEAKIGFNTSAKRDLNMRFFEVLASGALLVTEQIDAGMHELFGQGEHFVAYRKSEADGTIQQWLRNPEERERIAARGRSLCLAKHTYRHRAQSIVDLVASHGRDFSHARTEKKKLAHVYWSVAAALHSPPFSMAKEARRWLREGCEHSRRWAALPELLRYGKRAFATWIKRTN